MSHTNSSHGGASAGSMVRNYADLLNWLPDPPETFYMDDLPSDFIGEIRSLAQEKVISKEGWEAYDEGGRSNNTRRIWKVERWASYRAEEIVAERDAICPCGHSGLQNHGDHYQCGFGLCEREFERDELAVDA